MKNKKCQKNFFMLIILSYAFFLTFCCGALGDYKTVSEVEGIFYLDAKPVSIEMVDGKISRIVRKEKLDNPGNAGLYVAPGLIDHQVNGFFGVDFVDADLTVERIRKTTHALWKVGITTYLPTLTTNSRELLVRNFAIVARASTDPEIGDSIPGFHIEGPYISPLEGYRGVHRKEYIRPPDWDEFLEFYKAADGKILEITVAPETKGAIDFIRNCTKLGLVVAVGHTAADAETIKKAVDAGAVVSTHLGNGCANMIHRHDNPLWPQLAEDRLTASIIVDGHHLRLEEVQTFFKVKGTERTILVSDTNKLAGMPPGEYERHGKKVMVTPEGMITVPGKGILAGASFPISVCVGNVMKFTHCSLADAIHMASRNPARLHNLTDRGQIKPGKRADLILFTLNNNKMTIQKTIVGGKLVYQAQ